jgi:hypothetical protein
MNMKLLYIRWLTMGIIIYGNEIYPHEIQSQGGSSLPPNCYSFLWVDSTL